MTKKLKIILIIAALLCFFYSISWTFDFSGGKEPKLGITFSKYYAAELLALDWKETYLAILDEINPTYLRLIAYWQYIEPEEGEFNFEDLDWQIEEAEKRNKEIILIVGHRVPRWPECHSPSWAQNQKLKIKNKKILDYLEKVILRYKENPAIKVWQVENEPLFFLFGECPEPDRDFLKKQIALVKSLDPDRPILITDSGELSLWLRTAGLSEILGTTIYREVWNKYVGYFKHLYPPVFYTLRVSIAKKFFGNQKVIVAELQAEPWGPDHRPLAQVPLEEQLKHFAPQNIEKNIKFAKKTGIEEIYLWGAEWWYWLKTKQNNSQFWDEVKRLFNNR